MHGLESVLGASVDLDARRSADDQIRVVAPGEVAHQRLGDDGRRLGGDDVSVTKGGGRTDADAAAGGRRSCGGGRGARGRRSDRDHVDVHGSAEEARGWMRVCVCACLPCRCPPSGGASLFAGGPYPRVRDERERRDSQSSSGRRFRARSAQPRDPVGQVTRLDDITLVHVWWPAMVSPSAGSGGLALVALSLSVARVAARTVPLSDVHQRQRHAIARTHAPTAHLASRLSATGTRTHLNSG